MAFSWMYALRWRWHLSLLICRQVSNLMIVVTSVGGLATPLLTRALGRGSGAVYLPHRWPVCGNTAAFYSGASLSQWPGLLQPSRNYTIKLLKYDSSWNNNGVVSKSHTAVWDTTTYMRFGSSYMANINVLHISFCLLFHCRAYRDLPCVMLELWAERRKDEESEVFGVTWICFC